MVKSIYVKMKLSEWYEPLRPYTAETVLIPFSLPAEERNRKVAEVINQWGRVFVRLDELSPKYFHPCTSAKEVWDCLNTVRTLGYVNPSGCLCLRKWVDFSELLELRCFMYNGLTAISQNDANKDSEPMLGFINETARGEDNEQNDAYRIKEAAKAFITMIEHLLPMQCTIDIAFDRNLKFQVVEVNSSFKEQAGTGLFDEDNDADMFQLEFGQRNPRFRYFVDLFRRVEEC